MPEPSLVLYVCATPRSGSYLLCEALRLSGRAGAPEEYLWMPNAPRFAEGWGVAAPNAPAYREALIDHATSADGVFASKVMWGYAGTAGRVMRGGEWGTEDDDGSHPDIDGLLEFGDDARFVFMRRGDTTAQAVSYSKAVKADAWAKLADGSEVPGAMPVLDDGARRTQASRPVVAGDYDYHHIRHFRDEVENANAGWAAFFERHAIRPIEVTYEQLVADFEGTCLRILDEVGRPTDGIVFGERRMQRQRDHVSRRWLLRFREDDLAREIAEQLVVPTQ